MESTIYKSALLKLQIFLNKEILKQRKHVQLLDHKSKIEIQKITEIRKEMLLVYQNHQPILDLIDDTAVNLFNENSNKIHNSSYNLNTNSYLNAELNELCVLYDNLVENYQQIMVLIKKIVYKLSYKSLIKHDRLCYNLKKSSMINYKTQTQSESQTQIQSSQTVKLNHAHSKSTNTNTQTDQILPIFNYQNKIFNSKSDSHQKNLYLPYDTIQSTGNSSSSDNESDSSMSSDITLNNFNVTNLHEIKKHNEEEKHRHRNRHHHHQYRSKKFQNQRLNSTSINSENSPLNGSKSNNSSSSSGQYGPVHTNFRHSNNSNNNNHHHNKMHHQRRVRSHSLCSCCSNSNHKNNELQNIYELRLQELNRQCQLLNEKVSSLEKSLTRRVLKPQPKFTYQPEMIKTKTTKPSKTSEKIENSSDFSDESNESSTSTDSSTSSSSGCSSENNHQIKTNSHTISNNTQTIRLYSNKIVNLPISYFHLALNKQFLELKMISQKKLDNVAKQSFYKQCTEFYVSEKNAFLSMIRFKKGITTGTDNRCQ